MPKCPFVLLFKTWDARMYVRTYARKKSDIEVGLCPPKNLDIECPMYPMSNFCGVNRDYEGLSASPKNSMILKLEL